MPEEKCDTKGHVWMFAVENAVICKHCGTPHPEANDV